MSITSSKGQSIPESTPPRHLFDDPVWPVYGEKQPLLEEALLHLARAVHELQHGGLRVRPDILSVLGVEVVLLDEDTQAVLK